MANTRGGARPGAGRPKGSKNKNTNSILRKIAETHEDLVEEKVLGLLHSEDDKTVLGVLKLIFDKTGVSLEKEMSMAVEEEVAKTMRERYDELKDKEA